MCETGFEFGVTGIDLEAVIVGSALQYYTIESELSPSALSAGEEYLGSAAAMSEGTEEARREEGCHDRPNFRDSPQLRTKRGHITRGVAANGILPGGWLALVDAPVRRRVSRPRNLRLTCRVFGGCSAAPKNVDFGLVPVVVVSFIHLPAYLKTCLVKPPGDSLPYCRTVSPSAIAVNRTGQSNYPYFAPDEDLIGGRIIRALPRL